MFSNNGVDVWYFEVVKKYREVERVTMAYQVITYCLEGEVRRNGEESQRVLGLLVCLGWDFMGSKKPKGWRVFFGGLNEAR